MKNSSTLNKRLTGGNLSKSKNSLGIIETVFVVDSTVYAIIRHLKPVFDETGHSSYPLFNNHLGAVEEKLTPFEVVIMISNIDLEHSPIDPTTLIGKYANVLVIGENRALSAEYIGKKETFGGVALKLGQNILYNARVLAGPDSDLLKENSVSKTYLKDQVKLTDDQLELLSQSMSDWKGKVVRVENDSTNHNTTNSTLESEYIIPNNSFIKGTNNTKMKTQDCHMPVTIFTAR